MGQVTIKGERNASLGTFQNLNAVPWAMLSAPVIQNAKDGLHQVPRLMAENGSC